MSGYRVLRILYKYLAYTGDAKDYEKCVPLVIKYDPLVIYMKHYIRIAICPFCGKKFSTTKELEAHLANSRDCGKKFKDFMELTVDRYLIFRSADFRRKMNSLIKKYYEVRR